MFSVHGLAKFYGGNPVFQNVSVRISPGERVGLIGRNGAGKTTFLRCLAGLSEPDEGHTSMPRDWRLSYLSQREDEGEASDLVGVPGFSAALTVEEAALSVFAELQEMERQLRVLEEELARSDQSSLLSRYGAALEAFENRGGYDYRHRTKAVLGGLGFPPDRWSQPVSSLSGGERMRLALARLLLSEPDLALLDEPTNHLDVEGVEWLEGFLQRYRGAIVVVSHDRTFLDRVTTRTWELDGGTLSEYNGAFSRAMEQKAAVLERQARLRRAYDAEKAKLESFVARFRAGTRASQAQHRLRKLERLAPPPTASLARDRRLALRFDASAIRGSGLLCTVRGLTIGFPPQAPLMSGVDLTVAAGERIGVAGPNGSGKSTLLRAMAGDGVPLAGEILWSRGVRIGYFSQHADEFDDGQSVLDALLERHAMSPQAARDLLATFHFSGDQVLQPVGTLSGGERARLALLVVVLSEADVLLLDEPTNHLDLPTREALETALEAFPGALVIVSHDRYFLDRLTNVTWYLRNGTLERWDCAYSSARDQMALRERQGGGEGVDAVGGVRLPRKPERPGSDGAKNRTLSAARGRPRVDMASLEAQIERLEEEKERLGQRLADPNFYRGDDVAQVVGQYERLERELAALYARWEAAVDETVDSGD